MAMSWYRGTSKERCDWLKLKKKKSISQWFVQSIDRLGTKWIWMEYKVCVVCILLTFSLVSSLCLIRSLLLYARLNSHNESCVYSLSHALAYTCNAKSVPFSGYLDTGCRLFSNVQKHYRQMCSVKPRRTISPGETRDKPSWAHFPRRNFLLVFCSETSFRTSFGLQFARVQLIHFIFYRFHSLSGVQLCAVSVDCLPAVRSSYPSTMYRIQIISKIWHSIYIAVYFFFYNILSKLEYPIHKFNILRMKTIRPQRVRLKPLLS